MTEQEAVDILRMYVGDSYGSNYVHSFAETDRAAIAISVLEAHVLARTVTSHSALEPVS